MTNDPTKIFYYLDCHVFLGHPRLPFIQYTHPSQLRFIAYIIFECKFGYH